MNHVGTRAKIFFYTALATALLAYAAVVINAYARASLARVGCPAWYDCYGRTLETNQGQALIPAPTYANTPWQAKVHPFLAAALAILIIRLLVLGRQWDTQPNRRVVIPATAFGLLFAVVLPDVPIFGGKVPPWAAMAQLVATLSVLVLLWWLVMREQRFWKSGEESPLTHQLRPRVILALALIGAQTLLGAWLNVGQAGLPCVEYPTCHGEWWPPMDMAAGFNLDQFLGRGSAVTAMSLDASTAVHMVHRAGALVVLLYVGWLACHIFLVGLENHLCRYSLWIMVVLLALTSLGIMAVVMRLPIPVAVGHSAVSALLLLVLVTLYHSVSPAAWAVRKRPKT
jgi:cytochrome c oxidase assembly protein subunit 15